MLKARFLRGMLAAGVVLTPAIITLLLVYGYVGASLGDFIPHNYPLDDLYYWRQIDTFRAVGLDGGYYVSNEQPAPADFTHFDPHGPYFPALYGLPARIVGWEPYSPLLFNLVTVTLGLALVVGLLRLDERQLIAAGLLTATAWPVLLYIVSGMQESVHHAFALLLVIGFALTLRERSALRPGLKLLFAALIFVAALFRLTWALLALPYFVLLAERVTWRSVLRAVALTGVLIALAWLLTAATTYAPYADNLPSMIQREASDAWREDGVWAALTTTLDLVGQNIADNIDFFDEGLRLEVVQRYQIAALIGVLAGWLAVLWRRRADDHAVGALPEAALHLYNLGAILALNIVIYTMAGWRDYRVLAPHLLLTGFLLVARRRFWLVGIVIVTNLLMILPFKDYYLAFGQMYLGYDHAPITRFEDATRAHIVYEPDAPDAWCNTLLMDYHDSYAPALIGLPAGIGMSYFVVPDALETPLRSR